MGKSLFWSGWGSVSVAQAEGEDSLCEQRKRRGNTKWNLHNSLYTMNAELFPAQEMWGTRFSFCIVKEESDITFLSTAIELPNQTIVGNVIDYVLVAVLLWWKIQGLDKHQRKVWQMAPVFSLAASCIPPMDRGCAFLLLSNFNISFVCQ